MINDELKQKLESSPKDSSFFQCGKHSPLCVLAPFPVITKKVRFINLSCRFINPNIVKDNNLHIYEHYFVNLLPKQYLTDLSLIKNICL